MQISSSGLALRGLYPVSSGSKFYTRVILMTETVSSRLAALGLELPVSSNPVANYVSYTVVKDMVYVSGQLPITASGLSCTGHLGGNVDIDAGISAARQAGLQVIAKLNEACDGDLERVAQIIRLDVFVASTPDFADHPQVANGVSDLMVDVFGDVGRHTRAAVGVAALPLNAPVEVSCIARLQS